MTILRVNILKARKELKSNGGIPTKCFETVDGNETLVSYFLTDDRLQRTTLLIAL